MSLLFSIITYNPYENNTTKYLEKNYFYLNHNKYETLLIDNSDSSKSRQLLSKKLNKASIYHTGQNLHYPGSLYLILNLFLNNYKKYNFLAISNDDVIISNNFSKFVEAIESIEADIYNGILLDPYGRLYSAGGGITYSGYAIGVCHSQAFHKCRVSTPYYASYADGALFILRRNAVKTLLEDNAINLLKLRYPYLDDILLGLIAWRNRLKIATMPIAIGTHIISQSYGKAGILLTRPRRAFYIGISDGFRLRRFQDKFKYLYILRNLLRSLKVPKNYIQGIITGVKINLVGCRESVLPLASDNLRTLRGLILPEDLHFKRINICL
jgi:hypothetical protein